MVFLPLLWFSRKFEFYVSTFNMVLERDIEETLDDQTLDGTLAKGTDVDISAAVATTIDARISAAMNEWFWCL